MVGLALGAAVAGAAVGAEREPGRAPTGPGLAFPAVISPGTARSVTKGPFFPVRGKFYYGEAGARFGASRGGRRHEGQDVFSRKGATLVAVRNGVVVDRGRASGPYSSGKGNYIAIYSPVDKRSYIYFHMLRASKLKRGDRVEAGDRVGAMGCSGLCFGVHLHFEIRLGRATLRSDLKPIDPLPYLKRWDKADPAARKTGYGRYNGPA